MATKKETLQEEAKKLDLEFTEDTTIVELEEMIEGAEDDSKDKFKDESKDDSKDESKDSKNDSKEHSRKTEKVTPKKVKTNEERIAEAKKGSFLVFDMNGKMTLNTEKEKEAIAHAQAIDGRYEEVK